MEEDNRDELSLLQGPGTFEMLGTTEISLALFMHIIPATVTKVAVLSCI